MSFLRRLLTETGTYWSHSSYDQYGDQSWASPAAITCRWEDKTELFIDEKGDESHSKAIVWTTTALAVGGYLFLGTSSTANPETVSGADKIRRVEKVQDVKGRTDLYKGIL